MVSQHLAWIVSRAAGTAALLFASAAISLGLLMGSRLARRRRGDLRAVHEALSLATLAALVVHAGSLLADNFLHLGLADVTIPLVSGYQRVWTSAGIVGGWMLALLGLSYYVRGRIGQQRWRRLHRFTALAWVLGVAHAIGEGTDARTTWFLTIAAETVVPAAALLVARLTPQLPADSQAAPRGL